MADYAQYAVAGDSKTRRILTVDQLDALGEAILALTSEVWILTDRHMVLEEVLKSTGLDVTKAVESFVPSAEFETRLDARRDKLIATIMSALQGQSEA
jgi:hypothetical protein